MAKKKTVKKSASKKSSPKKGKSKTAAVKKTAPKKAKASAKLASKSKKISKSKSTSTTKAPILKLAPTRPAKTSNSNVAGLISPLRDYVLVVREGESDRTPGGLYIPETAKERPAQGRVVAVGGGAVDKKGRRGALDVRVGDLIMFGKWSGTEVKIANQDLLIMKESDILGVMD